MKKKLMLALFTLAVLFPSALKAMDQKKDPRISNQEMLALINMDPVDVNYRTNYDTHVTGVLLVPSSGPIKGSKGWYGNLAVPAGTLVDIPNDATFESFVFTAPNGQTTDAVRVTLAPNSEVTVNACGNGHKPKGVMLVKLLDPRVEIHESVREVPTGLTREDLLDAIREAGRFQPQPRFEARPWHDLCTRTTTRKVVCTALAIGLGAAAGSALSNDSGNKTCNYCQY